MIIHVERIRLEMARKKMTSNDLAKASGIGHTTISMIMSGKKCRPVTLGKIAAALGVDPAELYDS